jgi:hypothetical protein
MAKPAEPAEPIAVEFKNPNGSRLHFVNVACKRWLEANKPQIYAKIVDESYKTFTTIKRHRSRGRHEYDNLAKLEE